jgi:hypothetical protein
MLGSVGALGNIRISEVIVGRGFLSPFVRGRYRRGIQNSRFHDATAFLNVVA